MFRKILSFLLVLSGLGLGLGFAGRFHGGGDALAVVRPVLVVAVGVLSVVVLVRPPRVLGWIGAAAAGGAAISLVWGALVLDLPHGARAYSVYQKNLLFRPALEMAAAILPPRLDLPPDHNVPILFYHKQIRSVANMAN